MSDQERQDNNAGTEPQAEPEVPPGEPEAPPGEPAPAPGAQGLQEGEPLWGMLCHLTALAGFIGIPFGNIIGPLVIWLIKKDTMPFVDDQGKESLNFQISMTLYGLAASILLIVPIGLIAILGGPFLIVPFFLLIMAVSVVVIVLVILASVEANKGKKYRYPLTIRFLK